MSLSVPQRAYLYECIENILLLTPPQYLLSARREAKKIELVVPRPRALPPPIEVPVEPKVRKNDRNREMFTLQDHATGITEKVIGWSKLCRILNLSESTIRARFSKSDCGTFMVEQKDTGGIWLYRDRAYSETPAPSDVKQLLRLMDV